MNSIHQSQLQPEANKFHRGMDKKCGSTIHHTEGMSVCRLADGHKSLHKYENISQHSMHQSKLKPRDNKFHLGNRQDARHYWLTPPVLYASLDAEFDFDFDPCPHPLPADFDGLTCEWGKSNYVNPPFGSIIHQGKKKGPTAWARKAITEMQKGKRVVLVYPIDKWVLMLLAAGAGVRNLGDVRWHSTEDGKPGKGTGRHIAMFILEPKTKQEPQI